ncbi:emp24/gp25L/p24 family/GOLD-domain-containing protein [Scheffersomyces xylosifermentans]|uniref:emp24/gp25L/p24 family/GOLD-domain-containing protein n=1 Tax=Scheffersomyces xylosifermentans TaxID=1304137 RepID=UPI00315D1BC3
MSVLCVLFALFPTPSHALGLTIHPTKVGDKSGYSSRENLRNCVSYPTVKDDIILVTVKSGDKVNKQFLNLIIFDDENNSLRSQRDISNEVSFMFTNLNNPKSGAVQEQEGEVGKRSNPEQNIINQDISQANADPNHINELINSNKGKSMINICFDNLYADKSWSFHPEPKDVELYVDIKNLTTIQQTNYNNYAQYFNSLKKQQNGNKKDGEEKEEQNKEFTQQDFEDEIKFLKTELDNVIVNLQNSEMILQNLMEQEFKLRDVNEAIFSEYTKASVVIIACTILFGLVQLIYFRCYLKKRKVL